MTHEEARRVAPNLDLFLYRPALSDPPVCSFLDCEERITLRQLLDMHEFLDLQVAMAEKAAKK